MAKKTEGVRLQKTENVKDGKEKKTRTEQMIFAGRYPCMADAWRTCMGNAIFVDLCTHGAYKMLNADIRVGGWPLATWYRKVHRCRVVPRRATSVNATSKKVRLSPLPRGTLSKL